MKWLVAPAADLRWRCWDDELVVYHVQSGDTHLLNPLAAEALRCLCDASATVEELAAHVARTLDVEPDDELLRQMQQCVAQFDELGLIEPADAGEATHTS